jgi:hypothetical protein
VTCDRLRRRVRLGFHRRPGACDDCYSCMVDELSALLATLLLLLGHRADTIQPERFAAAVWAESQHAPRPPYEWARLMVTIAENESRLSQRIADGKCRPLECDRGKAKGMWQLHRNTLNRDSWGKQDGDVELQAHLASEQLKRAYWTCSRSGQPWLVGTINAYAGRRCGDKSWPGLQARLITYRRLQ